MIMKLLGYQKIPKQPELGVEFERAYKVCRSYTMTSKARMFALWEACNWLNVNNVQGSFVECGVWKGGSSMLAAINCQTREAFDRELFLFDTFTGMTEPESQDIDYRGSAAQHLLKQFSSQKEDAYIWAVGQIDEVRRNMQSTGFNFENVHLIEGDVEATIQPNEGPEKIALLRLDTDWYASTKHELEYLYRRIVPGGFLIIDDYGHWLGCKAAVDEFFDEFTPKPFFYRIDYTGIMMQVPLG